MKSPCHRQSIAMTATSEYLNRPLRDDEIAPDIQRALKRIATGWRIRLTPYAKLRDFWPWEVIHHGMPAESYFCLSPATALAEYHRLTAPKEE